VASFAGYKFVPPGVHALVWSEAGAGAALPLRAAAIKHWGPRERVALKLENGNAGARSVDEAELRALDPQMAPYPFGGLEGWKRLSAPISRAVLEAVLPGVVDSLTPVEGEADEVEEAMKRKEEGGAAVGQIADKPADGPRIRLPVFDLKRSWRPGAAGDEVTRWSRDKSDLWARVCAAHGGESPLNQKLTAGPAAVLGHTALAFLLVTQVWNAPALPAYRRLVSLQCRAHAALAEPELFPDALDSSTAAQAREAALGFVELLGAQIDSLPETAFAVEVPDLDVFYQDEIEALRRGLGAALAVRGWWGLAGRAQAAWSRLQAVGRRRGWEIGMLPQGDEDEDEEGEYAPVVVEM
jgi:A1 cistron-splicing factor AAR2